MVYIPGDCDTVSTLKHCAYNPNCELRGKDSLGRDCSTYINDKRGWPKWCSCHRIRSKPNRIFLIKFDSSIIVSTRVSLILFTCEFLGPLSCTLHKLEGPITESKGNSVGSKKNVTYDECSEACSKYEPCQSFLYHAITKSCFLKDKQLNGNETVKEGSKNFFSTYKTCKLGKFIYISSYNKMEI